MKYLDRFGIYAALITAILWTAASAGAQSAPTSAMEREIEDQLIAPCCWTQPVSQHYSEAAEKIRKEVHEMVAAGKSRDEILDYFVAQYGERILASPRPKGFNALIYILPWSALIVGSWLLIILLKKLRAPAVAPTPPPSPESRYTQAVEKEMKEFDE
jgi:cytochrome c-type biogenesis protein CcmH